MGTTPENKEAKRLLKETNVPFVEVYSNSINSNPTFFSNDGIYAYKGLNQIKEYANSIIHSQE